MATTDNRAIENADLWAAIRAFNMYNRPEEWLELAIERHGANPAFASRAIAEAARQVLATRADAN